MTKEKKREVVHTSMFSGPFELVVFEGYADWGDYGWFVGERYYYADRWSLSTKFWCETKEGAMSLSKDMESEYPEAGGYFS